MAAAAITCPTSSFWGASAFPHCPKCGWGAKPIDLQDSNEINSVYGNTLADINPNAVEGIQMAIQNLIIPKAVYKRATDEEAAKKLTDVALKDKRLQDRVGVDLKKAWQQPEINLVQLGRIDRQMIPVWKADKSHLVELRRTLENTLKHKQGFNPFRAEKVAIEWLQTKKHLRADLKQLAAQELVNDKLLRSTVEMLKGIDSNKWPEVIPELAEDPGTSVKGGKGGKGGKGKGGGKSAGKKQKIKRHWPEGKLLHQLPGTEKKQYWDQFAAVDGDQCTEVKKFKAADSVYGMHSLDAEAARAEKLPAGMQQDAAKAALANLQLRLERRESLKDFDPFSDKKDANFESAKANINLELCTAWMMEQSIMVICAVPEIFQNAQYGTVSVYINQQYWESFYQLVMNGTEPADLRFVDDEIKRISSLPVNLNQKTAQEAVLACYKVLQQAKRLRHISDQYLISELDFSAASLDKCCKVLHFKYQSCQEASNEADDLGGKILVQKEAAESLALALLTWEEEQRLASRHYTTSTQLACRDGGDLQHYCEMLFHNFKANSMMVDAFSTASSRERSATIDVGAADPEIVSIVFQGAVNFKFGLQQADQSTPVQIALLGDPSKVNQETTVTVKTLKKDAVVTVQCEGLNTDCLTLEGAVKEQVRCCVCAVVVACFAVVVALLWCAWC